MGKGYINRPQELPFQPAWAAAALNKPSPYDMAELAVLREFYIAWEAMHAIPNDKLHKNKREAFAKTVMEKANLLRSLNQPKLGALTLNGMRIG